MYVRIFLTDEEASAARVLAYRGETAPIRAFIRFLVDAGRVDEAKHHAEKLAEMGYAEALGYLADCLYSDRADHPIAHQMLSTAEVFDQWLVLKTAHAQSDRPGSDISSFEIGYALEDRDEKERATPWFGLAAEKGHQEAAIYFGFALIHGIGIEKSVLDAARWFMRSLQMEPSESPESDPESWPVEQGVGWSDWHLLGEMLSELVSLDERLELVRIVSAPTPALHVS